MMRSLDPSVFFGGCRDASIMILEPTVDGQ
jgi:hypothetical protein